MSEKIKILLVEDEDMLRDIVETMLTSMNFEVVSVSNGFDAVCSLDENPDIRIGLSDVKCAKGDDGFDGLFFAQAALKRDPTFTTVFMSGNLGQYSIKDLEKLSRYFIAKPFTASQLERTLALAIDHSRPKLVAHAAD